MCLSYTFTTMVLVSVHLLFPFTFSLSHFPFHSKQQEQKQQQHAGMSRLFVGCGVRMPILTNRAAEWAHQSMLSYNTPLYFTQI
jgi:hypothetical protein